MYQQTLYKIVEPIKSHVIKRLNKSKKWKYGYNKEYDIIVISKTGQIGQIYEIQNLVIALPLEDNPFKRSKKQEEQYWEVFEKRKELKQIKTIFDWKAYPATFKEQLHDYIDEEFRRRDEGFWFYNKGITTYITGTHYMYLQWSKIDVGQPDFREANRLFFIFWEACKSDTRCYGMAYLKNRRSDSVSYQNLEQMLKRCLQIKLYQSRLITHSFSNRFKMVWTDQKLNLPTESQHLSLQEKNLTQMKDLRKWLDSIQLLTGKIQVITPMTVKNLCSLYMMRLENGRDLKTSLITGG
jgi:hypothetical protein